MRTYSLALFALVLAVLMTGCIQMHGRCCPTATTPELGEEPAAPREGEMRPGGILAVWSSGADEAFTRRLKQCGFQTETVTVRARKPGKGGRHTIWLAGKP